MAEPTTRPPNTLIVLSAADATLQVLRCGPLPDGDRRGTPDERAGAEAKKMADASPRRRSEGQRQMGDGLDDPGVPTA